MAIKCSSTEMVFARMYASADSDTLVAGDMQLQVGCWEHVHLLLFKRRERMLRRTALKVLLVTTSVCVAVMLWNYPTFANKHKTTKSSEFLACLGKHMVVVRKDFTFLPMV